jgi:hypothetical protein
VSAVHLIYLEGIGGRGLFGGGPGLGGMGRVFWEPLQADSDVESIAIVTDVKLQDVYERCVRVTTLHERSGWE